MTMFAHAPLSILRNEGSFNEDCLDILDVLKRSLQNFDKTLNKWFMGTGDIDNGL